MLQIGEVQKKSNNVKFSLPEIYNIYLGEIDNIGFLISL